MPNKMLIDSTHPEETRVVVLRGNRVEEFDFETAQRKQLRGNIYLAKVTRVEPSLQAAFIDYGGNRHGFLAFSEIHPDYYQIPVADRQALLDEDARAHDEEEAEAEQQPRRSGNGRRRGRGRNRHREARRSESQDDTVRSAEVPGADAPMAGEQPDTPASEHTADETAHETPAALSNQDHAAAPDAAADQPAAQTADTPSWLDAAPTATPAQPEPAPAEHAPAVTAPAAAEPVGETANPPVPAEIGAENPLTAAPSAEASSDQPSEAAAETPASPAGEDTVHAEAPAARHHDDEDEDEEDEEEEDVDTVGGADAIEEVMERAAPRYRKQYKIQEVIKRRQVMLVQVVKEERGTKGAALTTYLSLAGRYSVLMPNTARGGGISRKITSGEDRKRMREIAEELDVPEGMGVILRTAGANRTKEEVRRDFEYLMRLWETVRDLTLRSSAPTLVYEEGSLIKRSIRDLYSKDIEEIVVAGDNGYREAKDFMRMLMPGNARSVKHYAETQPIFARYGIESQLDAMFSPNVQLRSGGYIVINQTEALVAIDVNSGRSTREHHIEDTALKTNCEAADEVARQLRLRDLAGLIVIDFIDMDEKRNNRTVERRLKDALRNDRARIQLGRISHFGLMEMSRQRIRTSVLENSTEKCPHCGGTGHVRSVSSVSLQLLRAVEETMQKGATHNLVVRTRPDTALYVLNHKRAHLNALEERFQVSITIDADDSINGTVTYAIDRGEQVLTVEQAKAVAEQYAARPSLVTEEEDDEPELELAPETSDAESPSSDERFQSDSSDDETAHAGERDETDEPREEGRRRRRRRRPRGGDRGPRDEDGETRTASADDAPQTSESGDDVDEDATAETGEDGGRPRRTRDRDENGDGDGEPRRRRRGRRGGRRNRRERGEGDEAETGVATAESGEAHPFEAGQQTYPAADDAQHEASVAGPAHADADTASTPAVAQQPADEPRPAKTRESRASAKAPEAEGEPAQPAPSRRRSTVREPAPGTAVAADSSAMTDTPAETATTASSAASSPTPENPAPAAATAEPAATPVAPPAAEPAPETKPRRTGWWAKRLLGGDS